MLQELRDHYDALEEGRLALIRKVRDLPPDLLNRRPGADRWSILEDIQHLVLAERKTALGADAARDAGKRDPEMLKAVFQVLDHDVAVDVPDPDMVPDGDADLEDLIREWETSRQDLQRFLENCGPDDLERPAARHTVAGPLTVLETLRLLASHFGHHRRRIEAAILQA